MAKKIDVDEETMALIEKVNIQKAEIAQAERPTWITDCSFSFQDNGSNSINLHVEIDVAKLVNIAGFLLERERYYATAVEKMKIEAPPFKWRGYAVSSWIEDIHTRINKIQIGAKRKKLESLEARLNLIISPEMKRQMELAAIQAELAS